MPRCPVCKTSCTVMPYERVPIHHCGSCGGYWVNPNKLDIICERRELNMPEPVKQAMMNRADQANSTDELFCISCGCEMVKERFKYWDDIQIDRCPKCNMIWLDAGELEKCQIYWEYMQDHPEAWGDNNIHERRAMVDAALTQRKAELADERENAAWRRQRLRARGSFGSFGSILGGLFG